MKEHLGNDSTINVHMVPYKEKDCDHGCSAAETARCAGISGCHAVERELGERFVERQTYKRISSWNSCN